MFQANAVGLSLDQECQGESKQHTTMQYKQGVEPKSNLFWRLVVLTEQQQNEASRQQSGQPHFI